MATWNLADIRTKVRQVTGRLSTVEMSNDQIDEYINRYYQYTFPAELKLDKKFTYYELNTSVNQQEYTYPRGFTNFVPPATIDNLDLLWYQDPGKFNDENPEQVTRLTPFSSPATATISGFTNASPGVISVSTTTGFSVADTITVTGISETGGGTSLNGNYTIASLGSNTITTSTDTTAYANYSSGGTVTEVLTSYSTILAGTPITPGSVIVNDDTETFTDDGDGALTGDQGGSGTINYTTGALTVVFNTTPTSDIDVSYISLTIGRPTAVLSYDNKFKFYPAPDTVYRFKVQAYAIVTPLVNASDTPELEEWGPTIAYGASRDIHADLGENERYAQVTALYREQLAYIMRRTHQNLLNTRSAPMF